MKTMTMTTSGIKMFSTFGGRETATEREHERWNGGEKER